MARASNSGFFITPIEPIKPDGDSTANVGEASHAASNSGHDSNTASDGTIIIDPTAFGPGGNDDSGGTAGGERKRRGRKPGTKNAPKTSPGNIDALEALLLGVLGGLQFVSGIDEFAMDKAEAHGLAEAWAGVARHYDWLKTGDKALDWGRLISVVTIAGGSRVMAYRLRNPVKQRQTEPARAAAAPPSTSPQPRHTNGGAVEIPGLGRVDIPPGAI